MPKSPLLRRFTQIPILGICLLWSGGLIALEPPESGRQSNAPKKETSQAKKLSVREQSEALIPWEKLTDQAQEKLQGVLSNSSVFHRSPIQHLQCDHDVYLHLIRYPELVVNMWELMGVSKLRMAREQDFVLSIDDGYGTNSQMELVYGNSNLHIFYAEGSYKGSVIPTTSEGRVVLIVESEETIKDGKPVMSHRLDMFIQFDKSTSQLLVKTLQGLFLKMVDINFAETSKFIGQIDEIIRENPDGMKRLTGRLTRVQTPIRKKFTTLVEHANAEYVRIATAEDK